MPVAYAPGAERAQVVETDADDTDYATPEPARTAQNRLVETTFTQTPVIAAGQSLPIDLHIKPRHPYRSYTYLFKILSKAADDKSPAWSEDEGILPVKGLAWPWRVLPYLVFLGFAAAILLLGTPALFALIKF